MLAAAEKRSSGNSKFLSADKRRELEKKKARDTKIGKISAAYQNAGMDVPFGLGMAKDETLDMHYKRAMRMTKGRGEALKREKALQNREKAMQNLLK